MGGRITLDPSLRAQSPAEELANLSCDNVVLVMKTEDGSTKLVHADGVLAGGWGECHYQVTDVPPGGATFSGQGRRPSPSPTTATRWCRRWTSTR